MTRQQRLTIFIYAAACILALGRVCAVPAVSAESTTLIDRLKPENGAVRTLPQVPRVGAWSLLLGKPKVSAQGRGLQIDKAGQAVVYPCAELLTGPVGTIRLSVVATTPPSATDEKPRVLLDSIPFSGTSRILLTLKGAKLSLVLTGDRNQTATAEGTVNWTANSIHKIAVLWGAGSLDLQIDGKMLATVNKPVLPAREPMALVLGNSRDYQMPALLAVSDLRLSREREETEPTGLTVARDNIPNTELTWRMAQGYQRRMYPVFDYLRKQRIPEGDFAYAMAYSDVGDLDQALRSVTPMATSPQHALYLPAIFLRADLLAAQRNYTGAYEQLQVIAHTADIATNVRAQVKQAEILYEQGSTAEAMRMIGEIIAAYTDRPEISDAYLMIGLDQYKTGNYQQAFRAFQNIGIPGAPPRQTTAIGERLEIKVADADLNVRVSDAGLPVKVTSTSGDAETVDLRAAFSRGVYVGYVETALGAPTPGDGILQVQGNDKVQLTYIDHFTHDGADVPRTVGVDLATDSRITLIAQSALEVYAEVREYQKKALVNDTWQVMGDLPETASSFFRDPVSGEPLKAGKRLDPAYIASVKPGQAMAVEVIEPDGDITANPDTLEVELSTPKGRKMTVTLTESGPHTGVFTATVKTTPANTPQAGMLEVSENDAVTARYVDPRPAAGTRSPVHQSRILIQQAVGTVGCGVYSPRAKQFFEMGRVAKNAAVVVFVKDRDLDATDDADTVTVNLTAESGATASLRLAETGKHTGEFSGTIKLIPPTPAPTVPPAKPAPAPTGSTLNIKEGDLVTVIYTDTENPTGKPEDRTVVFRVNIPEDAKMTFYRQVLVEPELKPGSVIAQDISPKVEWQETTTLTPGNLYSIKLQDGDLLAGPMERLSKTVSIKATNGASVEPTLFGASDAKEMATIFQGIFYVRLGDKTSPQSVYVGQTGAVVDLDDGEQGITAVNVQGNDEVRFTYIEPLAANGTANVKREVALRVASDAQVALLNAKGNPLETIKPGMAFDVWVNDPDGDVTDKRDKVQATVTSSGGDTLQVTLTEADSHAGIFIGTIQTVFELKPVVDAILEVPFGGRVTVAYTDAVTVAGTAATRTAEIASRPMADATAMLLTKVYDDPSFEVETLVRLGESLFAVGAAELAAAPPSPGKPRTNDKLQQAGRFLQRVIDNFPSSEYVVESLFLTGKILREEQKRDAAQKQFQRIVEDYPESDFVPQALFHLVGLYLEKDDIDNAIETAIRLIHGYAKSPLAADTYLRIGEYYYQKKQYEAAASVFSRILERFPDHALVDRVAYRLALTYYRAEDFANAITKFTEFADTYPNHELTDDALYWAAFTMTKRNDNLGAYRVLTRLLLTMPSEADKYQDAKTMRDDLRAKYPALANE